MIDDCNTVQVSSKVWEKKCGSAEQISHNVGVQDGPLDSSSVGFARASASVTASIRKSGSGGWSLRGSEGHRNVSLRLSLTFKMTYFACCYPIIN